MSEIYPKENENESAEDYSDMPALIPCSELDAYNAKNQCFSNIFCIFHIADMLISNEDSKEKAFMYLTKFRRLVNVLNVFLRLPNLTVHDWDFTAQLFHHMVCKSLWDGDGLIDHFIGNLREHLLASEVYSDLEILNTAFGEPLEADSLQPLMAKLLELNPMI